ncbi:MAG: cysteine--tRNA ligase [Candidatus Aenigmarchaeota archaeon]|nr:cysteine--tRNA ligase [Candidatus Aenigmarchaeota archaeon]
MPLSLFNTLTRRKEAFRPLDGKLVRMYSCGPTVYDYAHIGNFRAYMVSDLLRRYLEYKGYRVKAVMNLTDVDDKTIKGSQQAGISLARFTEKYKRAFFDDLKQLNIRPASAYPEATRHVGEMVTLIKSLIRKGYAYKSDDGSVYYDISKKKGYGKLAHLKVKDLKAGARVSQDQYEKGQAQDFALWKAWTEQDGDVGWEAGIGKGRPGWHIECSAMSMKYLGETFDIHTGGVDLIFPHHENEIAQSEGGTGRPFARYWVHNEHLLVDGRKMSKSLGNFYTLRDLLGKGHSPRAIRYLLLGTHYRQKLNFTLEGLGAAANSTERLLDFMDMLDGAKGGKSDPRIKKLVSKAKRDFESSMDNDLNIAEALAAVFDLVKEVNRIAEKGGLGRADAKAVKGLMLGFDKVLGVLHAGKKGISAQVERLISQREAARKKKDFGKSDEIRSKLAELGVILEDTPGGVKWKLRKG